MNSVKILVIQTALMPQTLYYETEQEKGRVEVCENFDEVFALLKDLNITKETEIYVNRGPGSYTGIRTGISYVLGLLHGGLIQKSKIHSYTSFDLIRAAENESDLTIPIYMKAWPRVPNGKLSGTKGYFQDGDQIMHLEYESIQDREDVLFYTREEEITEDNFSSDSGHQTSTALKEKNTYSTLIKIKELSTDLTPLYINPVNITKKK